MKCSSSYYQTYGNDRYRVSHNFEFINVCETTENIQTHFFYILRIQRISIYHLTRIDMFGYNEALMGAVQLKFCTVKVGGSCLCMQ